VFVKVGGRWLTPPLSADILPGVMRAVVLEAGDALIDGPIEQAVVTREMVRHAEAIVIANALRGTMRARLR
jgi:para-aminobenzoate synthetase/4-amino-4-deoxychorismate lyase